MATITKTPSNTWKAIIRKRGWPTTIKTFRTRRDARDWAQRTEDDMVRGVYIDRADPDRVLLSQALNRYLSEVSSTKRKSTAKAERHKAKALKASLGAYSLAAITPDRVARYRNERLETGKSANTVQLELALLSHLFTIAIKEWCMGLQHNPVTNIRRPGRPVGGVSSARDPHRFVNDLQPAMIDRLVDRLESRGKDRVFTRLFENYSSRLELPAHAHVLEIGSGTGVVARSLARNKGAGIHVTGIDQSPVFVEVAQRLAAREKLADRLAFEVGDAHALQSEPAHFDAVIAHTLISHVSDPAAVLGEARRVLKPGGTLVVFDGDYASLTYAFLDAETGRSMDWALARTAFNNPVVMRRLPRLLESAGLDLIEAVADVVSEIGQGSYFRSMAETYAPLIAEAGLASAADVDAWLDAQREAMESGRFFASCNYYSVFARRPD